MAIIAATQDAISDDNFIKVTWTNLTESDTAEAYAGFSAYGDRSVQLTGEFGGATIGIQGSNDGTNFETMNDPLGDALSFTSKSLKQILEYTQYVKPVNIVAGTAQSVTITVVAKRMRG